LVDVGVDVESEGRWRFVSFFGCGRLEFENRVSDYATRVFFSTSGGLPSQSSSSRNFGFRTGRICRGLEGWRRTLPKTATPTPFRAWAWARWPPPRYGSRRWHRETTAGQRSNSASIRLAEAPDHIFTARPQLWYFSTLDFARRRAGSVAGRPRLRMNPAASCFFFFFWS